MKLLVNGCSFSRGDISWPHQLQSLIQCDLVNLAQAGAGNTYIHESTVEELSHRNYDYVIIMWSGLARFDFKVNDIEYFKDSKYTSKYQKTRNDWQGKTIYPINDQDYVEDNWVFGCGVMNREKSLLNTQFLNGIYKYLNHEEFTFHSLQHMIALQSFLKINNIPYYFTFYENYVDILKKSTLFKLLDTDYILTDNTLSDVSIQLNDYDIDGSHPGPNAHKYWANLLKKKLF